MIDGIIKGDGTSRLLAGSLPATYEEFRQLAAENKLPVDLLLNTEGWSQIPTFLNKASLLSDPTAEKYGAGVVTPDAAFSFLGQYALHWWKRKSLGHYEVTYNLPTGAGSTRLYTSTNTYFAVSDGVELDADGDVVLKSPYEVVGGYMQNKDVIPKMVGKFIFQYYSTQSPKKYLAQYATSVNPTKDLNNGTIDAYDAKSYYQKKYVNDEASVTFNVPTDDGSSASWNTLYPNNYIAYSPTLTVSKNGQVILENPTVKMMDSTSLQTLLYALRGCFFKATGQTSEEYDPAYVAPTNAQVSASGGNYNIKAYPASNYYSTSRKPTEWKYVQSKDRDAYPDSGEQDNYEYVYLGVPLDNAATASKIEVGSYIGTGTSGSGNPNSLTFGFVPKVWGIMWAKVSDSGSLHNLGNIFPFGVTGGNSIYIGTLVRYFTGSSASTADAILIGSYNGKTVTWYHSSAEYQLNLKNVVYYYIAIG